jgi:hypothetical protein
LGSQEIQQLPYQHIVKWLPSKMRSRDPGPDDCLDIQVETASGKKDLRMRCQSEPAVQEIIADIRQTVQVRSLQCCFTLLWCSAHAGAMLSVSVRTLVYVVLVQLLQPHVLQIHLCYETSWAVLRCALFTLMCAAAGTCSK